MTWSPSLTSGISSCACFFSPPESLFSRPCFSFRIFLPPSANFILHGRQMREQCYAHIAFPDFWIRHWDQQPEGATPKSMCFLMLFSLSSTFDTVERLVGFPWHCVLNIILVQNAELVAELIDTFIKGLDDPVDRQKLSLSRGPSYYIENPFIPWAKKTQAWFCREWLLLKNDSELSACSRFSVWLGLFI